MPTIVTHAIVPLAVGVGLAGVRQSGRLIIAGMIAAILPDAAAVLAFRFGIPYASAFGRRGASHSLLFAALLGFAALAAAKYLRASRGAALVFVLLSATSHGLLDMLTTGGLGVALLWPASEARFFAPWRIIEVSPLSLRRVFSRDGWPVWGSEFRYVWLPCLALCLALLWRSRRSTPHVVRQAPNPALRDAGIAVNAIDRSGK